MYTKSQEIELRLRYLVTLIREGRYSAGQLAAELGVSVPTVSRCVGALRERGYRIRAVRSAGGWAYTLVAVAGNGRTVTVPGNGAASGALQAKRVMDTD